MTRPRNSLKQNQRPCASFAGSARLSDLAELTLLACTIRHNAAEMQRALDRMARIADMLEANRARLKAQNAIRTQRRLSEKPPLTPPTNKPGTAHSVP